MSETLSASGRFCGDFRVGRIAAPSVANFDRDYARIGKPVIITNLPEVKAAARKWSPEYLINTIGKQEVVLTRLRNHKLRSNNTRYIVSFSEYATRAFANDPEAGKYCVQQIALPEAIAGDMPVPKLVGSWSRIQPHFWLSTPGHVTETHRDGQHNLLAQVVGTKKVTLFSPIFTHALYSHDANSSLARYSRIDMDRPDLYRFPAARELAPTEVVLNAGEALFLPVYWWHRVQTLEVSVSVNFWWAPPLHLSLHPQLPLAGTPEEIFRALHALADLSAFPSEFDVAEYLWSQGFQLLAAAYLYHCVEILLAAKSPNPVKARRCEGLVRAAKALTVSGIFSEDEFQTIRFLLQSCERSVGFVAKRGRGPPRQGIADLLPLVAQARRLAVKLRCARHFHPARRAPGGPLEEEAASARS